MKNLVIFLKHGVIFSRRFHSLSVVLEVLNHTSSKLFFNSHFLRRWESGISYMRCCIQKLYSCSWQSSSKTWKKALSSSSTDVLKLSFLLCGVEFKLRDMPFHFFSYKVRKSRLCLMPVIYHFSCHAARTCWQQLDLCRQKVTQVDKRCEGEKIIARKQKKTPHNSNCAINLLSL